MPFESLAAGLRRTDTAMREWVGLLMYWAAGESSALFPGPRGAACEGAEACRR